jgi:hypothetical protein
MGESLFCPRVAIAIAEVSILEAHAKIEASSMANCLFKIAQTGTMPRNSELRRLVHLRLTG